MIEVRKSKDRGAFNHGWLRTYHTFSFADYHDPKFMGFHSLRVINEDFVEPSKGFPTHSHRDMEIITYILEGALEHKDSMGNTSTILPGEVQRMTAGSGVTHSEFNASSKEAVHLLQIWILPEKRGLPPSYEQKKFSAAEKVGAFRLVASPNGRDASVAIHQDVQVFAATLGVSQKLDYVNRTPRATWLQVARGKLSLNEFPLEAGDGVAISESETLKFSHGEGAEILLFDLPKA